MLSSILDIPTSIITVLSLTILDFKKFGIPIAEIIIISALTRKESRGLHYNLDYPSTKIKGTDTVINIDTKNNIRLYQQK